MLKSVVRTFGPNTPYLVRSPLCFYRCGHGYCGFRRVETSGWHDLIGRQLCLHCDRSGRGPSYLWQPEEVHRLHAHLQHSRNLPLPGFYPFGHSPSSGYSHHFMYWFGNWHGKHRSHLIFLFRVRFESFKKALEIRFISGKIYFVQVHFKELFT